MYLVVTTSTDVKRDQLHSNSMIKQFNNLSNLEDSKKTLRTIQNKGDRPWYTAPLLTFLSQHRLGSKFVFCQKLAVIQY